MEDQRTGDRRQETGDRQPVMRRGADIAEWLVSFAVAVVGVTTETPRTASGRHIASQLLRCATSGGANYEEARGAESRDDFVHKVSVASKEMRESVFWLEVINQSGWSKTDLASLIREARELAAILGASARTARSRGAKAD